MGVIIFEAIITYMYTQIKRHIIPYFAAMFMKLFSSCDLKCIFFNRNERCLRIKQQRILQF